MLSASSRSKQSPKNQLALFLLSYFANWVCGWSAPFGALHFFVLGVESDKTIRSRQADEQTFRQADEQTKRPGGQAGEGTSGRADKADKTTSERPGACGVDEGVGVDGVDGVDAETLSLRREQTEPIEQIMLRRHSSQPSYRLAQT